MFNYSSCGSCSLCWLISCIFANFCFFNKFLICHYRLQLSPLALKLFCFLNSRIFFNVFDITISCKWFFYSNFLSGTWSNKFFNWLISLCVVLVLYIISLNASLIFNLIRWICSIINVFIAIAVKLYIISGDKDFTILYAGLYILLTLLWSKVRNLFWRTKFLNFRRILKFKLWGCVANLVISIILALIKIWKVVLWVLQKN